MGEQLSEEILTYQQLVDGYRAKGYKLRYYGRVKEKVKGRKRRYHLYKTVINPRYKTTLLITTGFHGDEFNGPIALLEIIDKIAAFAKTKRVRVVVYLCINPSGFDTRKHYNASREEYNNYFMLYVLKNGRWVGVLKKNELYTATPKVPSPAKEVRPLQKDIQKYYDYPVPNAVLDIHQQKGNLSTGDVFAYIFDRRGTYNRIMKKIERVAKIARNESWTENEDGRKIPVRIDEDGFVFVHDGSVTDMFYRHGTKWTVTSETKTTLSLEEVAQINWIWAKELIKLIAQDAKKNKKRKK